MLVKTTACLGAARIKDRFLTGAALFKTSGIPMNRDRLRPDAAWPLAYGRGSDRPASRRPLQEDGRDRARAVHSGYRRGFLFAASNCRVGTAHHPCARLP